MNAPAAQAVPGTDLVSAKQRGLVAKFAERFGVDPTKMMNTLKQTCFRQKEGVVISDEQMMGLLVVADQYGLNPWTKEIYAFPDKNNGIVPVVGVDGWSRIINGHAQHNGIEFRYSEKMVENPEHKTCPEWCELVIHRKDREQPTVVREYFDEVYRAPFKGQYGPAIGPWQTHTKRMLRHKTLIQGARVGFGFVGIYDEDEADRIVEGNIIDVTPTQRVIAAPVSSATDLNNKFGAAAPPIDGEAVGVGSPGQAVGGEPPVVEPARKLTPYETLEQVMIAAKTPEEVGEVLDRGRLGFSSKDGDFPALEMADQKKLKKLAGVRVTELQKGN